MNYTITIYASFGDDIRVLTNVTESEAVAIFDNDCNNPHVEEAWLHDQNGRELAHYN